MSDADINHVWFQFGQVTALHDALLESVCQAVAAAGYTADECRIDKFLEVNGGGRCVLVVRGVPTFAIETRVGTEDEYKILYTFSPEPLAHLDIIMPAIRETLLDYDRSRGIEPNPTV